MAEFTLKNDNGNYYFHHRGHHRPIRETVFFDSTSVVFKSERNIVYTEDYKPKDTFVIPVEKELTVKRKFDLNKFYSKNQSFLESDRGDLKLWVPYHKENFRDEFFEDKTTNPRYTIRKPIKFNIKEHYKVFVAGQYEKIPNVQNEEFLKSIEPFFRTMDVNLRNSPYVTEDMIIRSKDKIIQFIRDYKQTYHLYDIQPETSRFEDMEILLDD